MTSYSKSVVRERSWTVDAVAGAGAGVVGGIAFGALMAMAGMLPMIGMLVGREDALVGLGIHLLISATIGVIYGLLLGGVAAARRAATGALLGAAYGFVWWILGPLVIMPTMMGMGPQFGAAFSGMNVMSLMGHVIYGVILGVAFPFIARNVAARSPEASSVGR